MYMCNVAFTRFTVSDTGYPAAAGIPGLSEKNRSASVRVHAARVRFILKIIRVKSHTIRPNGSTDGVQL